MCLNKLCSLVGLMTHATICCHLGCQNHVTNIWVIVIVIYCLECLELVLCPSCQVWVQFFNQVSLIEGHCDLNFMSLLIFFIFHVTHNMDSTVLSPKYPSLCWVWIQVHPRASKSEFVHICSPSLSLSPSTSTLFGTKLDLNL